MVHLSAGHVNGFLLAFIIIITIIAVVIIIVVVIPLIENTKENSMKDPGMYSQALVTV